MSGEAVTVRDAREDDAAAFARVHERCWTESYAGIADATWLTRRPLRDRIEDWVAIVRDHAVELRAAEGEDRRTIGFVSFGASRDEDAEAGTGEIIALYVDPARQRDGAGTALLERAVADLRAQGFARATLWTLEGNAPARRFYAAHGWKQASGRKEHRSLGAHEVRYARDL
ncbi:MAG TPA: GNAT family N-acetyltransferase [Solirubrobacteraceae bacterium]|nr:GNAT family N-acetyltransferase [Solirubrobacteraceae bacterium]